MQYQLQRYYIKICAFLPTDQAINAGSYYQMEKSFHFPIRIYNIIRSIIANFIQLIWYLQIELVSCDNSQPAPCGKNLDKSS